MDISGVLYVADSENRLIYKFSDNGKFISQFHVDNHENARTILDMALDQLNGLIHCIEVEHKENNFSPRNNMLVFDLEGQPQHIYHLNNMAFPIFIAINKHHEIIISDRREGCLRKVDMHGNYLSCMGELKFPVFITVGDGERIIVADRDYDSVFIFNDNDTIRQIRHPGYREGAAERTTWSSHRWRVHPGS